MSIDYTVSDTIAAATMHQLEAAGRAEQPTPDPDASARATLQTLGQLSPGAALTDALLALCTGSRIVPVDPDTLTATRDPFTSHSDAADWYATRYREGSGLVLGEQSDGSTLLAIQATAPEYANWISDVGVERRDVFDGDGRHRVEQGYRNFPHHVQVSWQPPPIRARVTPVAVGRAAMEAAVGHLRSDRAGVGERGWVAWAVAPEPGRRFRFATRQLAPGVTLLVDGVLPMAGVRRDGWALHTTGVPMAVETPDWLTGALGAKVRRTP